jgi:hypothetical protein
MCENEWRAANCPESESLYCGCPFYVNYCEGAWSCEDMYNISVEIMASMDSNGDGQINLGDNVNVDHLDVLIDYCDANGDGSVDACEVHSCVVAAENEWRAENCPEYGAAYCETPFNCA